MLLLANRRACSPLLGHLALHQICGGVCHVPLQGLQHLQVLSKACSAFSAFSWEHGSAFTPPHASTPPGRAAKGDRSVHYGHGYDTHPLATPPPTPQLNEIEARNEEYPETIAFMRLLNSLIAAALLKGGVLSRCARVLAPALRACVHMRMYVWVRE